MNTVQRVIKNSGASLLAQISNPIASFILILFVSRNIGVSGLGVLASALSLFYIFQAFSSLGLGYLITREVAQNKSKAGVYIANASLIGICLSILMAASMCIIVHLLTEKLAIINSVYILSLALLPSTLFVVFSSICRAFEKLEYITISLIIGNILKASIGAYIVVNENGIEKLSIVIMASYYLTSSICLLFAYKCIPEKYLKFNLNICKYLIRTIPVFALIIVLNTIRWNVDIQILNKMMGELEVGYYVAAFKLMNIFNLALSCCILAIQPVLFRLIKSSIEKFKFVCMNSLKYLFIIIFPCAIIVMLLSDEIILIIFKQEFLPATKALKIIIWVSIFSGANLIFANVLIAGGYQKINLQANFLSMIVNICLNLMLIPVISFIGASIASLVSSIILLLYQYVFVSKYLIKINLLDYIKKPGVSAAAISVLIFILDGYNMVFILLVSITIYTIILFILKTFDSNDKNILYKIFKNESKTDLVLKI